MKRTIFLFLSVLLMIFSACNLLSSKDDKKTGYPFIQKTWEVQSPERASWVGVSKSFKLKADTTDTTDTTAIDTVMIDNPLRYSMEIARHPSLENTYELIFTDSTYNRMNVPDYAYVDSLFGFYRTTISTEFYDEYAVNAIYYKYDCSSDPEPVDTLNIVYAPYQQPEDTTSFYQVVVSGALETVQHIICGTPADSLG